MQVVREQITRALAMKPSSLDQLKNKLRGLNYSEILRLRQSERMSQDDFQSPPIMYVWSHTVSIYTVITCLFLSFFSSVKYYIIWQLRISTFYPSLSSRLYCCSNLNFPPSSVSTIVNSFVLYTFVFVSVAHAVFVLQWAAGKNSARDLRAHQATTTKPAVWGKLLP